MATRIKALGTFRNPTELRNGIVRRGQTAIVRDGYAEELADGGKAEILERNVDASTNEPTDSDEPEGSESPESSEPTDGAPGQPDNWKSTDLPEDCPKYDLLKGEDIHTLGDLKHCLDEGIVDDIKGIGPAYVDRIENFLTEAVPELE